LSKSTAIDRKKLARERIKWRRRTKEEDEKKQKLRGIRGLYSDGRRDSTLKWKTKCGKKRPAVFVEEHICMIEEPESRYVSHVTPKGRATGLNIAKALFKKVHEFKSLEILEILGGDNCRTNFGYVNGFMVWLERLLHRVLQRLGCLLHFNELPFKELVRHYYGKTTGPSTWSGELNHLVNDPNLTDLEIVKFRKIKTDGYDLSEEIVKELSNTQNYLHLMGEGITLGEIDEMLASRDPGKEDQARWLTHANRMLRRYISTENPDKKLKACVNYIIKVYGKLWFYIKSHPKFVDGPKNFFKGIELIRDIPVADQKVVQKSFQENAFMAHPENVLCTMCADEDKKIRKKAVKIILDIRQNPTPFTDKFKYLSDSDDEDGDKEGGVSDSEDELMTDSECESDGGEGTSKFAFPEPVPMRPFKVPRLNFTAKTYHEMIFWDSELYEPPLTKNLTDEELKNLIEVALEVPDFPCHTQMVERGVKMVTEASSKVCGAEARDAYIRQKIKSRTVIPEFCTKKDIFPMMETE
jgi:hypothetical protein